MTGSAPGGPRSAKTPAPAKPPVNALAIASVLAASFLWICQAAGPTGGFLGGHVAGTLSLASLGIGLIAVRQIRRSRSRTSGLSLALIGILFSLALAGWTSVAFYEDWMFDLATGRAGLVERDLNRVTSACWRYSAKHHHELPPADSWREMFEAEGSLKKGVLGTPVGEDGPRHYAMNALLGGLKVNDIKDCAKTILFFECEPGTPEAGGPGNLRRNTPYAGYPRSHVIAFADGHCEYRKAGELDALKWLPRGDLECPLCAEKIPLPPSWTPDQPIECPVCLSTLWDPDARPAEGIWDRTSAGLPGG